MAKITYYTHDSKTHTIDVQNGLTVMEGAIQNDIPGIDADCGGGMSCATCHVYIKEDWLDKLPTKEDGEEDMLDMAGSHGHFELNVFKPLIAHNILQSIDLLADSTKNFALYCVKGIKANKKKIKEHLDNSLMLVTSLAPHIGYDNAAKIAKRALKNNTTLKHETLKTGLINEKDYERIVDPRKMIYPT